MDKSFEGTAFILGVILCVLVNVLIPDAIEADEMRRAHPACAQFGGLEYVSKRASWSRTLFATCEDGTHIELPAPPVK